MLPFFVQKPPKVQDKAQHEAAVDPASFAPGIAVGFFASCGADNFYPCDLNFLGRHPSLS